MHHRKFVQHMKDNADRMYPGLTKALSNSERCKELLLVVPEEERRQDSMEVYHDLTNWLSAEADSIIEQHYVALGKRRAQQGVPLSNTFWAVCIARDYLWERVQQECLLEDPVEFWGGVSLLRLINKFFDRVLYFALLGYEKAGSV